MMNKAGLINFHFSNGFTIRRNIRATHQSPAQLLFGYEPKLFPGVVPSLSNPFAESRLQWLSSSRTEATEALTRARTLMASRALGICPEFEEGDRVWLDTRNLNLPGHRKFSPHRTGPFKITRRFHVGLINWHCLTHGMYTQCFM